MDLKEIAVVDPVPALDLFKGKPTREHQMMVIVGNSSEVSGRNSILASPFWNTVSPCRMDKSNLDFINIKYKRYKEN
ncbi:MAG: hypothetical protein PHX08_08440 [Lachnospiraceae bacterium]|nr:hypothetical protein [Lachnospiraceae bacterium]